MVRKPIGIGCNADGMICLSFNRYPIELLRAIEASFKCFREGVYGVQPPVMSPQTRLRKIERGDGRGLQGLDIPAATLAVTVILPSMAAKKFGQ